MPDLRDLALSRRRFLRRGAAAAVLAPVGVVLGGGAPVGPPRREGQPVVVATWNNPGATAAAWAVLAPGGRALDAVEAGARVPEADPQNNTVGLGGLPDRDGRVTLDACIMDENGRCGSVAALEHILHPVSVARRVMERTPHIMLVGQGAYQFARAQGFPRTNLLTEASRRAWRAWLVTSRYRPIANIERHDTIGLLALGADGRLAGACTTSGMAYKLHGRVGDSPLIGAGLFVDDAVGAATATGVGEEVIRVAGSHLVVELMRQGYAPEDACREAVTRIARRTPSALADVQVGFLALRRDGVVGGYALRYGFNFAHQRGAAMELTEARSFLG